MTRVTRNVVVLVALAVNTAATRLNASDTQPDLGLGMLRNEIGLSYLLMDKVCKDLDLTDAQKAKIAKLRIEAATDHLNDQKALGAQGPLSHDETMKRIRSMAESRLKRNGENLRKILNDRQLSRAGQLSLQFGGVSELAWPEPAAALELSESQTARIAELVTPLDKERAEFRRSHPSATARDMAKYIDEIYRRRGQQLLEVLSTEQKKRFNEIQGAKLDITPEESAAAIADLNRLMHSLMYDDAGAEKH